MLVRIAGAVHIQRNYIIFNGSLCSRRGGFHTKSHGVTKTSADATYGEATRIHIYDEESRVCSASSPGSCIDV